MLATKMKTAIEWAYSEIGWKMANGQLFMHTTQATIHQTRINFIILLLLHESTGTAWRAYT